MIKLNIWNMTTGEEYSLPYDDIEEWEKTSGATRLCSHYDMLEEKWYFFERVYKGNTPITLNDVYRVNIDYGV